MKILFETGSTCVGGAERVVLRIAQAIRRERPDWTIDAVVLTVHGGLEQEYRDTFHHIHGAPPDYYQAGWWVDTIARRGDYDIVHCIDSFEYMAEAARRGREAGHRVAYVQNVFPNVKKSPFKPSDEWLQDACNHYAAIITEFKANLAELPRPGRAPHVLEAIPNGIDTEFWTPGCDDGLRDIDVLWCARTDEEKGIRTALELAPRLCGRGLSFYLITSEHDGPVEELLELVRRWPAAFRYSSQLGPTELRALYRRAKIFLSTSTVEGMPATPLEAAACGCWPIVPRIDGLAEVFKDSPGFLYDPELDIAPLAKALEYRLSFTYSDGWRGGVPIARSTALRYSVGSMTEAYIALYERIAKCHQTD